MSAGDYVVGVVIAEIVIYSVGMRWVRIRAAKRQAASKTILTFLRQQEKMKTRNEALQDLSRKQQ